MIADEDTPATAPRCPELARLDRYLRLNSEWFEDIVRELPDGAAAWRPKPGAWSVVECVEHLARTASAYLPAMSAAVERARREGRVGSAPYDRGTRLGRWLLRAVGPEGVRRMGAPRVFRPTGTTTPGHAYQEFRDVQEKLRELLARADGLDVGGIRMASPVSGLFRLSLLQAFEVHALHGERHLAQAERVLELHRRQRDDAGVDGP